MTTNSDVKDFVIITLSGFTRILDSNIDTSFQLKQPPLSFNDDKLAFLAMSLRGFVIVRSNNQNTLLVAELRKKGLDVKGLISLIESKVR